MVSVVSWVVVVVGLCQGIVTVRGQKPSWDSTARHSQLSACVTQLLDARQQPLGIINLQPLARHDGLPRFTAEYKSLDQTWNYSFNPCIAFDIPHNNPHQGYGDNCHSVAVCKYTHQFEKLYSYTMGIQSIAKFKVRMQGSDIAGVDLVYTGIKSMRGRDVVIQLLCDEERVGDNDGLFKIIQDTGKGTLYAELYHRCCCVGGCETVSVAVTTSTGDSSEGGGVPDSTVGTNDTRHTGLTGSSLDPLDSTEKEDEGLMLMVVGSLVAVVMLVALVGGLCYIKSTHSQFYSKLPVKTSGTGQGLSVGLKTDLRDYEPAAVVRKKNLPVLQDTMINLDSLEMCQRLGGGIFGDTHLAKWHEMTVAVKRLTLLVHENQITPDALTLMKDEVWFLSRQRHKNIVTFLGLCLDGKLPSIITEYVIGECLKDFIKLQGRHLSWPHRVRICLQVADGMGFLHSTKPPIIHRDLRCGNLFLSDNDVVKVADFGLIKLLQPVREECPQDDCCCCRTMSACPASIRWTCPELLAHPIAKEHILPPETDRGHNCDVERSGKDAGGRSEVITPACDVYSFAMVMWELPMGLDPFEGISNEQEVMEIVKNGGRPETPPSADMMSHYKDLMKRCWDQIPAHRPTFKQIATRLKDLESQARSYQKQLHHRQRVQKLQQASVPI